MWLLPNGIHSGRTPPGAKSLLKAVSPVHASSQDAFINERKSLTSVLRHNDGYSHGQACRDAELLGLQCQVGEWQFGISCPASLRLDVSRGRARPDVRLELLSLSLARTPHPATESLPPKAGPPRQPVCDWHVSGRQLLSTAAAMALSYVLFPDTMGPAICTVSKAGYVALLAPVLWQDSGIDKWRVTRGVVSTGREIRAAMRRRFGSAAPTLERKQRPGKGGAWSKRCACASMYMLQAIAGPAALLHAGMWCCQSLVPNLVYNCTALMGLIAALHEYNHLSREGRLGRLTPGPETEAAWHAAHKRAARRVAQYLGELPPSPPFAPVADLADSASVTWQPETAFNHLQLPNYQGKLSCLSLSIPVWPRDPRLSMRKDPQYWDGNEPVQHIGSISHQARTAAATQPQPPVDDHPLQSSRSSLASSSVSVLSSSSSNGAVASSPSGRIVADSVKSITMDMKHKQGKAELVSRQSSPPPPPSQQLEQVAQHGAASSSPGQSLMLYGRADHAPVDPPTTAAEMLQLAFRALYLSICFAPFMTLGVALLLLALVCHNQEQRAQQAQLHSPRTSRSSPATHQREGNAAAAELEAAPGVAAAAVGISGRVGVGCRVRAWKLLLRGCKSAGAAFQKWGQWSSTRGDLFPPDFCDVMSSLQQDVPTHSLAHTRKAIQAAFGLSLDQLFEQFDPVPIASGSIAQVYRAVLRPLPGTPPGAPPLHVAVKVRHPGVDVDISRDFKILKPLAQLTARSSMLRGLSLKETLAQFSHTMTAQTDLRVEAAHLNRAGANFGKHHQVAIPQVVRGLSSPGVLVETWEAGRSVLHFCKRRTPINTQLVSLGVDAYLAMLLKHNFVHTDLHPGNILVRMLDPQGRVVADAESGLKEMLAAATCPLHATTNTPGATLHEGQQQQQQQRHKQLHRGRGEQTHLQPQVVLIDYGLAEELTPVVRHHFISFLNCISAGNGVLAAKHVLQWSSHQECPNPRGFIRAMQQLFAVHCNVHAEAGIDLDLVMKSVLRLCCVHQVTIDSAYAALAVAVCVLVGFATSLDPRVNLMDAATPCLLAYSLTGRVVGRMYS